MWTQFDQFCQDVSKEPAARTAAKLRLHQLFCEVQAVDAETLYDWGCWMEWWMIDKLLLISARTRLF